VRRNKERKKTFFEPNFGSRFVGLRIKQTVDVQVDAQIFEGEISGFEINGQPIEYSEAVVRVLAALNIDLKNTVFHPFIGTIEDFRNYQKEVASLTAKA
jgi:hypothetical protein